MVLAGVMAGMRRSGFATQWEAANVVKRRLALDPGTGAQDVLGLRNLGLEAEVLRTEAVAEEDLMTNLVPEGEQQLDSFRDGGCG